MRLLAITREVSPHIDRCELTHLARQPIDVGLAARQHQAYEARLAALGCQVLRLPAGLDLPDSVFVEDVAVVLDELAVITRPGAVSRRPEVAAVAEALLPFRPLFFIDPPATLDGGDVLQIGKQLYVGLSSRSNLAALDQLRALLAPWGYSVAGIPVRGCLHLKSAVTLATPDTLLLNPDWVDPEIFGGMGHIAVDPQEPFAANALWIEQGLIYPLSYPRTLARLETHGIPVIPVDVSELIKAEGGVTCSSIILHFTG